MANLYLKRYILEAVDNQLRENDPPITKNNEVYNEERYSKKLRALK